MSKNICELSRISFDAVIFTIIDKKLKVFLKKREKEPFKNKKELLGGLLQKNETVEECLNRKLKEIIKTEKIFFQQFFTFTNPKRDLRKRTISIGFIALINSNKIKELSNNWYEYNKLNDLAFDHKEIINSARKYLQKNISSLIVKEFMPELFPLNQLQEAYELIENKNYDNRNFRKRIINSKIVKETNKIEKNVSHRPAKLFKFVN